MKQSSRTRLYQYLNVLVVLSMLLSLVMPASRVAAAAPNQLKRLYLYLDRDKLDPLFSTNLSDQGSSPSLYTNPAIPQIPSAENGVSGVWSQTSPSVQPQQPDVPALNFLPDSSYDSTLQDVTTNYLLPSNPDNRERPRLGRPDNNIQNDILSASMVSEVSEPIETDYGVASNPLPPHQLFLPLIMIDGVSAPVSTPTPQPTSTATQTAVPTYTPTPTASATATNYPTPTPTSTVTPLPTETGTATPTATATYQPSYTPTSTPTETATSTPTATPTATATASPTVTPPAPNQIVVYPDQGGLLISTDGRLVLEVPAGAVTQATTLSYSPASPQPVPGYSVTDYFFDLNAFDENGNPITQFQSDLAITIDYSDVNLGTLDPNLLGVVYGDNFGHWHGLTTSVNTQAQTVVAVTTHFTSFALVVPDACPSPLPGQGAPANIAPAFVAAFNELGGQPVIGCPSAVADNNWFGVWTQAFQSGAMLVYNANRGEAYYLSLEYRFGYTWSGGPDPDGFLGLPLEHSTEAQLPAEYFQDQNSNFTGTPIQQFEGGFVGRNNGLWRGSRYYPIACYVDVTAIQIFVDLYPDDPNNNQWMERKKLVLRVGGIVDPSHPNGTSTAWGEASFAIKNTIDGQIWGGPMTLESSLFRVEDEVNPDFTLQFHTSLERSVDGRTGYAPRTYFANGDWLDIPNSYGHFVLSTCEGIALPGGGIYTYGDIIPPVIGEPAFYQDGYGNVSIQVPVTDNVAVANVTITIDGNQHVMLPRGNDQYEVVVYGLSVGWHDFTINAVDTSGNQAIPVSGQFKVEYSGYYGPVEWQRFSDDPVNSAIGNFLYSYEDAVLLVLGPDVVIERWFNHQSTFNGLFGVGWTSIFDMRLDIFDNLLLNGAQARYPDGHTVNFTRDSNGDFTSSNTNYHSLREDAGEYVLTQKDQTEYHFDADGRIIAIVDKDGLAITLNYNGNELSSITDASGKVYTFTYADGYITSIDIPDYGTLSYQYADGRLIQATDAEGHTAVYTYDENGCMLSITSPEGKPFLNSQTCDPESGRVTSQLGGTGYLNEFIYDDENRTTIIVDPYGNQTTHIYDEDYRIAEEQDALGYGVTYTYDEAYNPLTVTDKNGNTTTYTYDDNGNVLTVTDALGYVTTYTYDADNHMTSRTDALGNVYEYEYDVEGHLLRGIDPLGAITSYEYNADGLLTRTTDPLGHVTVTSYNSQGLPKTITDALGNITTKTYDEAGHLISETNPLGNTTTYQYNAIGQLISKTDPEGNTTTYEYDGDHNLIRETNADGYSRTFTYDDNNRLVVETDWAGNITTYVYDDLARLTSQTDPLGYTLTYEYDAVHHLIAQTDKRGATTIYTYDPNGNRLTETDALGHVTTYTYDVLNRVVATSYPCDCPSRIVQTVYDPLGRAIEQIDALGNSTYFAYDAVGRQTLRTDALGYQTAKVYDLTGNLITEVDALGNETHYTYDALNRVVSVTNRLGYNTSQEYDAAGRVTAKIDERGYWTEYVYDGNGRLLEMADPLGNTITYTYDGRGNRLTVTDALGRITTFVYDANSNVVSLTNPRGFSTTSVYNARNQVTTITDALGNNTTFTYDPAGAVLTVTDPLGYVLATTYDILGRKTAETNRNGHTTTYAYDAAGNLSTVTDALGGVTSYTYDANNNRLSETNALGFSTFSIYDALNRQVEVHDALGGVTLWVYDALGRLTQLVDANGHTTTMAYDAEGQMVSSTDSLGHTSYNVYDPAGNIIQSTDRNGNVTHLTYDALNRQSTLTNALGFTASTYYNAVGNVIERINFRGFATQYEYDENNNLIQQADALGGVTTIVYDALDRQSSITDANGHTTTFSYDAVGNLLTVTLPEGQVSSYTYDGEQNKLTYKNGRGFTTTYGYDALNRQVTETDPLGHVTTTEYDAIGQIVGAIDANGSPTSYGYDPLGRLISVTDALGYVTTYTYDAVGSRLTKIDANGNTNHFVYDAVNRLVSETNPLGAIWTYIYDPEGNLIQSIDANGQTLQYEFDAVHQMVAIHHANPAEDDHYTYDENGNLVAMSNPAGTATFVYDALDRLIGQTDVIGYTVTATYDAVGNRTGLIYPNGNQVDYFYNANDWLIIVRDPSGGQTGYSYEGDGQVRTVDQPNSTWTSYLYDNAGRLISLYNGSWHQGGSLVTAYGYTLDAVGNRLQIVERYTQGQIRTNIKSYSYNARYELLEAVEEYEGPPAYTVTTSYSYDPVGNRLSITTNRDTGPGPQPDPVTVQYSYDAANRMLAAGSITFTYDANGNRLGKFTPTSPPSQSWIESYVYDDMNRLTLYTRQRAQNGHVEQRVYSVYDALGRRVNKGAQNSSGTVKWTQYALDGLSYDQLAEFPMTGSPRVTELYRGFSGMLLSMNEIQGNGSGSQYWFAQDGLESVAATTKQNGQSTHEFFYDPYGQLIDENGHWEDSSSWTNPHNHYLLSGKEWDEESRLYYYGARFYDVQTGVWITPDPLRGEARVSLSVHPYFRLGHNPPNQADNANDPMSLHRYLYVHNNPVTYVDVNGYSDCGPYAKCREEVDPLIKFIFGLTGGWEFSLYNWLDSVTYEVPSTGQLFLPGAEQLFPIDELSKQLKTTAKVEFIVGFTIERELSNFAIDHNPASGVCVTFSPYARLAAEGVFPIPALTYGIVNLRWGIGGEAGISGKIKGCARVDAYGVPDLTQAVFVEESVSFTGTFKVFVRGEAELLVAKAHADLGLRFGFEYPLIYCDQRGCLDRAPLSGSIALYFEAKLEKRLFGGDASVEKSYPLKEGTLFNVPTITSLLR